MNQPPTPLGLQETIAESLYVTRPLLHRIPPWLHVGSHCNQVPAKSAVGLALVQGSAMPGFSPCL